MSEHWVWLGLTIACVAWYTCITWYVAIKGAKDIKDMLNHIGKQGKNKSQDENECH